MIESPLRLGLSKHKTGNYEILGPAIVLNADTETAVLCPSNTKRLEAFFRFLLCQEQFCNTCRFRKLLKLRQAVELQKQYLDICRTKQRRVMQDVKSVQQTYRNELGSLV